MQRVMIIGCCGAGKSTFAKNLQEVLDLELIHLDQYYWQPEWTEPNKIDWIKTTDNLINKSSWIIDGNYHGTMAKRLEKADTVLFLDYPVYKCFYRVIKRVIVNYGKVRPDMGADCRERFEWDFLHYVATFNKLMRPRVMDKLKKAPHVDIHTFKNDSETNTFLQQLKNNAKT